MDRHPPSIQWLALTILVAGIVCLPGCSPQAAEAPTQSQADTLPSPTPGLPAETATPTFSPLTAATPPIILEPAIAEPTITPTPPQVGLPLEAVAILEPGPGSQVTSPLWVEGFGGPSFGQRVHFRLFGEDGRTLSQATTYLFSYPGNPGRFVASLPFSLDLVAEEGRVEVSVDSLRDGQRSHLSTVSLILLSEGSPRVHPALHGPEKLTILSPRPNRQISGGMVTIEGAGWTESDLPLGAEVLDQQGNSVGQAEFRLTSDEPGELGTFRVDVPFEVDHTQQGRVVVYEMGKVVPGMIHLSSVDLVLAP
jgi:hypothetical protein